MDYLVHAIQQSAGQFVPLPVDWLDFTLMYRENRYLDPECRLAGMRHTVVGDALVGRPFTPMQTTATRSCDSLRRRSAPHSPRRTPID